MLPTDHRRESWISAVRSNLGLLLMLAAIPWGIEILDFVLPGSFDRFGIRPRQFTGLLGIGPPPFCMAASGISPRTRCPSSFWAASS